MHGCTVMYEHMHVYIFGFLSFALAMGSRVSSTGYVLRLRLVQRPSNGSRVILCFATCLYKRSETW